MTLAILAGHGNVRVSASTNKTMMPISMSHRIDVSAPFLVFPHESELQAVVGDGKALIAECSGLPLQFDMSHPDVPHVGE